MKKYILMLMSVSLCSCESMHPLIYNMTSEPIKITYTTANIHNNTVLLSPGQSAGSVGVGSAQLESLAVTNAQGSSREYSKSEISTMRPSTSGDDLWGYYEDGLHYIKNHK